MSQGHSGRASEWGGTPIEFEMIQPVALGAVPRVEVGTHVPVAPRVCARDDATPIDNEKRVAGDNYEQFTTAAETMPGGSA